MVSKIDEGSSGTFGFKIWGYTNEILWHCHVLYHDSVIWISTKLFMGRDIIR